MMERIEKRTSGYKRCQEVLFTSQQIKVAMLDCAIAAGMPVSYVLIDSWFTRAPLFQKVVNRGLLYLLCIEVGTID
ncbi:hypothetical protein [Paenibacillus uliginis]|uniref:hypothetical protein n=1 Tax=Paenibacillus uliginis TaxID=683737 RepID=UPI001AD7FE82|nr:hypothetical protein [Paenibacillus uliginis]